MRRVKAALGGLLVTCGSVWAQDASQLVGQKCLMCHSSRMLSQQRLTRDSWLKVVTKMRAWGAPLEPEEITPVASHLAGRFTTSTALDPPVSVTLREVVALREPQSPESGADPARGAALYAAGCAACHGPGAHGAKAQSLLSRPVLSRPADFDRVVATGRRAMPGFDRQLDSTARRDLLAFLRLRSRDRIAGR